MPTEDWAETRAREWLLEPAHEKTHEQNVSDLAALLREVENQCATSGTMSDWVAKRKAAWRRDTLAEVRRVVKAVMEYNGERLSDGSSRFYASFYDCGKEILARLEKL